MTSSNSHHALPDIQLQACLADPDCVNECRFLVGGKDIKYITVESGIIPPEEISFQPVLESSLPIFSLGDLNEGHVVKDQSTGTLSSLHLSGVIFSALRTYGMILKLTIFNLCGSPGYFKIIASSLARSL